MGLNPGSPGFAMPPAEDDFVREQKDMRRTVRENAAARTLEASQIGAGGMRVTDGGSITIEDPGQLIVASGVLNSAGTITAATDISAGGDVNAGADVNVVGDIYSPHARITPVVTSYVGAWINSDGRIGASASSAVYKQDFTPADTDPMVEAILTIALLRFRYIEAVKELGDDAPFELGAIAEYLETTPLREYVYRDSNGEVMGISYERLTIPLVATVQSLNARLTDAEATVASLTARLDAAGL